MPARIAPTNPVANDGDQADQARRTPWHESPPGRMVPAVERAVQLIDALANSDRSQGVAELSRRLGLPKSSVHGLLATLSAQGLATRNEHNGYELGPRVMQWAGRYASQSVVISAFQSLAPLSTPLLTETIMLSVLDGADVVYLDCRQGTSPLGVNFRIGGRLPAECTSSGKAMLATLSPDEVQRRLAGLGPRRLTPRSADSLVALLDELTRTAERGYAIDDEETAEGMYCFGAPVRAATQSTAVAAVAVSLIKATVTPERANVISEAIRALAARISDRLGAGSAVT